MLSLDIKFVSFNKIFTIGIILLFFGMIIIPSINATINSREIENDIIEYTTEIYGFRGKEEFTIKLTKTESKEVEIFLTKFENNINNIKTKNEIEIIFNDAISKLYSYGLFGNLKKVEIQNIFKINYFKQNLYKNLNFENRNENENVLCLIAGNVEWAIFFGLAPRVLFGLGDFFYGTAIGDLFMRIGEILFINLDLLLPIFFFFNSHIDIYDEGWIWTMGLNGIKSWEGLLQGQIETLYSDHCGVIGFTGIRVRGSFPKEIFFGFANHVKIEEIV